MTRNKIILLLVIIVVTTASFLLLQHTGTSSPENRADGSRETSATPPPECRYPLTAVSTDATPAAPVTSVPWAETLVALQDQTNVLFGADGDDRLKEFQTFVESLPVAELPVALKNLHDLQTQHPTLTGGDLEMRLVRRWAENDVRATADWTAASSGAVHGDALTAVAATWARQNVSDAAAWANTLPNAEDRRTALQSAADEAAGTDPKAALNLIVTLPRDPAFDDIITRATGAWATKAPQDAITWANQIADQPLRERIIATIATSQADTDPLAAATLAIKSLSPGAAQENTVIAILQRWAQTDPPAAKAWVNQFPEGPLRQTATKTLDELAQRSLPQ
jgi:hypothetical protein